MSLVIDLPAEVKQCLVILNQYGYEAFCVGGCVRDWLMGRIPQDFDITTNAKPEEVKQCFSSFRTLDTGIRHGTITIMMGNMPIECTTYRTESAYLDHRRPASISYSNSLREDCTRRDFTVNALCYHPDLGIQDFFGGIQDLESHTLRAIGNPLDRFDEDALRIVRALRFRSTLGFTIETITRLALNDKKILLQQLSKERINQEFSKLITGRMAGTVIEEETSVLNEILPGLLELRGYPRLFQELISLLTLTPPSLILRLSCILGSLQRHQSNQVPSTQLSHPYSLAWLKQYRYANDLTKAVTTQVELQEKKLPKSKIEFKTLLSQYDLDSIRIYLEYKQALGSDISSQLLWLNEIIDNKECWRIADLAIKGNEVQETVQCRPEEIGRYLVLLLKAVIENQVVNTNKLLLQHLLKIKKTGTD